MLFWVFGFLEKLFSEIVLNGFTHVYIPLRLKAANMRRLEPNMTQRIQVAAGVRSQVHQNVGSIDLNRDMPAQQEAGTSRRVNRKPSKLW